MKLQHYLRIVFAGALIALMGACATMTPSGPAALVGTWTNSLGTVWTIDADGTFHVMATTPKGRDLGQIHSHRRYDYNSRDSPLNGHLQKLQRARPV